MRISGPIISAAMLLACGPALAGEDADFGVPPTLDLRLADYAAPTPREAPGARTIRTAQLQALIQRDSTEKPLLVDVVGGEGHDSLPGAHWLPGAGRGRAFDDPVQAQLSKTLQALTGGNLGRPMVFFCASARCWLSYNATLRALALGYTDVYWYRGGIEAWLDAGGEVTKSIISD